METLRQQALDYSLGTLSKEEAILFEALLEEDDQARDFLIDAHEECAALSLSAPQSKAGKNLRSRILENCRPTKDFSSFLETDQMTRLRDNYEVPDTRYLGGGASVDMGDLGEQKVKNTEVHAFDLSKWKPSYWNPADLKEATDEYRIYCTIGWTMHHLKHLMNQTNIDS